MGLCAVRPDGRVLWRFLAPAWDRPEQREARRQAIAEAHRWGEPCVQPAPGEHVVWAVPLMLNSLVLGGLVAGISERRLFDRADPAAPAIDVRAACRDLLEIAQAENLTNAALLEARRREYRREQSRAEAIHAFKASPLFDLRALYQLEEPLLVGAIRRGDRPQARSILNHLLVGMLHRAGSRLDLVRSFFMELVSTMSRTAVEAGGSPEEVLGTNFDSLARLSALADEEQLSAWLHEMLERIMDAIRDLPGPSDEVLMAQALRLMSERSAQGPGRDEVAASIGMSPAHFSRRFRAHFGRTFTDVLIDLRTDRAAEMLARSGRPVKLIALECGFADQSHLTKVFRRRYRTTPARYRLEHQNTKA